MLNAKDGALNQAFQDNGKSNNSNQGFLELQRSLVTFIRGLPGNDKCCDCGSTNGKIRPTSVSLKYFWYHDSDMNHSILWFSWSFYFIKVALSLIGVMLIFRFYLVIDQLWSYCLHWVFRNSSWNGCSYYQNSIFDVRQHWYLTTSSRQSYVQWRIQQDHGSSHQQKTDS